jgi:hypothetical protein
VEPALEVGLVALDPVQVLLGREPVGAAAALEGGLVAAVEGL